MKAVKFFSIIFTFVFALATTTSFANDDALTNEQLRDKVVKIIDNPGSSLSSTDASIHLRFMINNDNEIVVLSTGTEDKSLDNFLKNKLNYKKVNIEGVEHGKSYHLKVQFKS